MARIVVLIAGLLLPGGFAKDHLDPAASRPPVAIASALAGAASAAAAQPRPWGAQSPRPEALLEAEAEAKSKRVAAASVGEAGIVSLSFPRLDAATVTMLCCLLGVPLVAATAAFFFVEVGLRPQDSHRPRPYPPAGWQAGARTAPGSMLRPGTATGATVPPRFGSSRMSLPGPRPATAESQPYPHFGSRTGTFTDIPPTLPSTMAELPPGGVGGGATFEGRGSTAAAAAAAAPPPLPVIEDDAEEDGPRVSPLSTAVVVKNPAGALVRLDGVLDPHPERKAVDIVSVKDGTSILRAILSEGEASGPECGECLNPFSKDVAPELGIRLETKAKSIPIAILDTRGAVYSKGKRPEPSTHRRVVLHRVGGEDGAAGQACAWVQSAGRSKFTVHYLINEPRYALTVYMTSARDIDYIVDAQGQIVTKSEPARPSNGSPSRAALWVKQGVDLALVSCIALAVQKLA